MHAQSLLTHEHVNDLNLLSPRIVNPELKIMLIIKIIMVLLVLAVWLIISQLQFCILLTSYL